MVAGIMARIAAPPRALALVALAYVLALAAAWGTLRLLPPMAPLAALLLADVAATLVVFAFSRAFDNSSFYDAYWSVAPAVIAGYLPFSELAGVVPPGPRQIVLVVVVGVWAVRLTANWLVGWTGLDHEDWRYVQFRAERPRGYWLFSFGAIHMFPTLCTFAGGLAMWPVATSSTPLGVLDGVGALVALGATAIEGVADAQLRAFRGRAASRGEQGGICDEGLWAWSRHPNYFGECGFWFGVWLLGVAARPSDAWWTALGPAGIVALFVFGTIPLAEARSLERRPAFAEHQKRVSMLVPWPPKKVGSG